MVYIQKFQEPATQRKTSWQELFEAKNGNSIDTSNTVRSSRNRNFVGNVLTSQVVSEIKGNQIALMQKKLTYRTR